MIFLSLFLTFFKIGAFTFGGGYAMIALIQQETLSHGWMNMEELINFIAVSESTPGPLAVNMATFVGSRMGGVFGAICATLGVVLPSFLIILIIARLFHTYAHNKYVEGAMDSIKAVVIGLIASALFSVIITVFFGSSASQGQNTSSSGLIFAGALLAADLYLTRRKLHPIAIILISAGLGITAGYAGLL